MICMIFGPLLDNFGESLHDIEKPFRLRVNFCTVPHDLYSICDRLCVCFRVVQRCEPVHENNETRGEEEVSTRVRMSVKRKSAWCATYMMNGFL